MGEWEMGLNFFFHHLADGLFEAVEVCYGHPGGVYGFVEDNLGGMPAQGGEVFVVEDEPVVRDGDGHDVDLLFDGHAEGAVLESAHQGWVLADHAAFWEDDDIFALCQGLFGAFEGLVFGAQAAAVHADVESVKHVAEQRQAGKGHFADEDGIVFHGQSADGDV